MFFWSLVALVQTNLKYINLISSHAIPLFKFCSNTFTYAFEIQHARYFPFGYSNAVLVAERPTSMLLGVTNPMYK